MIVNIVHSKNSYSVDVEKGIRAEQLYLSLNEKRENKVLLCKVDNSYRDLNHKINQSCSIEFLDMSDNYAWLVYQNSLILLYEKAVYDILGNVQVNVSNSLNKGLYTTIKGNVSADDIAKIEKRMKELVNAQLPIIKERIQRKELLKLWVLL